ncbi:MAG: hypothetical protein HC789_03075 [Microcoleus sp. CSU_2_2]|nr:hypothetical protein [Microcoleus sp. SU_5_3]NJS09422.1 hypothetical protein [Microcoleus sp. CSU_2_2]
MSLNRRKDAVPKETGSGKFLGGKVFEFWGDKIDDNLQLLVILYPDDAACKQWAKDFDINWVGLSTGGTVASASANYKTQIAANPAINTAINTLFPVFEPGSGLRIIMGFTIISGVAASLVTAIIIAVWSRIFRR